MATTIGRELEEEFLSAIRTGHEIALDALRPLAGTAHYVIPAMPIVRVLLAGLLPAAREAVASGYGFAEHLVANQRQFAGELIMATSPLLPGRTGPRRVTAEAAYARGSATPAGGAAPRQCQEPAVPGAAVSGRSR